MLAIDYVVNVLQFTSEKVWLKISNHEKTTSSVEPRRRSAIIRRKDYQHDDTQHRTEQRERVQKCIMFGCMLRAFHQRLDYDWGGKDSSQEGVEGDNTHQHRHSV